MPICGIEMSGSEVILVLLDGSKTSFSHIDIEPRKILLSDDENANEVKAFRDSLFAFFRENKVNLVVIKKRGKKGEFAKALYKEEHRFIDKTKDAILIHDWLETAGRYLIKRYGTANREKLIEIWAKHGRTYGQSQEEPAPKPKKAKLHKVFADDSLEIKISQYLFEQIKKNDPKAKEPDFQKWAEHIDGLLRLDKRTKEEIGAVIQWIQTYKGTNGFTWKSNILSTKTLREKFTKLWTQMNETNKGTGSKKGKYSFQENKYPTLNERNVRSSNSEA